MPPLYTHSTYDAALSLLVQLSRQADCKLDCKIPATDFWMPNTVQKWMKEKQNLIYVYSWPLTEIKSLNIINIILQIQIDMAHKSKK